ncbi:MAG: hypothetical protein WA974_08535 [Thermodesulfobacteriota bacterium]
MGVRTVTIEVNGIDEVREYVETHYGPLYRQRFNSPGMHKNQSLWQHSQFMLNGRSLKTSEKPVFKEGDRLDLLVTAAGG